MILVILVSRIIVFNLLNKISRYNLQFGACGVTAQWVNEQQYPDSLLPDMSLA